MAIEFEYLLVRDRQGQTNPNHSKSEPEEEEGEEGEAGLTPGHSLQITKKDQKQTSERAPVWTIVYTSRVHKQGTRALLWAAVYKPANELSACESEQTWLTFSTYAYTTSVNAKGHRRRRTVQRDTCPDLPVPFQPQITTASPVRWRSNARNHPKTLNPKPKRPLLSNCLRSVA